MYIKIGFVLLLTRFICKGANGEVIEDNLFRKDYIFVNETKSFYKIHKVARTWQDAVTRCNMESATFFYPEDETEANIVLEIWNRNHNFLEAFIAVSDIEEEGTFESIDGYNIHDIYHKWQSGEPNNLNSKENCVVLRKSGLLNDVPCTFKYNFICKKKLLRDAQPSKHFFRKDYVFLDETESFYKIHKTPKKWLAAKDRCSLEGAFLFYPQNKFEVDAIREFWKNQTNADFRTYIGISDKESESVFETVDGYPLTQVYNDWSLNEPNNIGDGEDCVEMLSESTMNDVGCDNKRLFICKKTLSSLKLDYFCEDSYASSTTETLSDEGYSTFNISTTAVSTVSTVTVEEITGEKGKAKDFNSLVMIAGIVLICLVILQLGAIMVLVKKLLSESSRRKSIEMNGFRPQRLCTEMQENFYERSPM